MAPAIRENPMTDIERRDRRPSADQELRLEAAAAQAAEATIPVRLRLPAPTGLVSLKVVGFIGLAWVGAVAWLMAISPVPPDTAPPPSALDLAVQTAMLGSWLAVFAGIATRQRFVFGASIAGGAILAGAGLLCLITGHTGMWIAAQIGAGIGLAGLGYGASRVA
jgi:hypothetical protein